MSIMCYLIYMKVKEMYIILLNEVDLQPSLLLTIQPTTLSFVFYHTPCL
jgi:hypothetical protein